MTKWHGGKGSSQRKVDLNKFEESWERIFGDKDDIQRVSDKGINNSDLSREDVSCSKSDD